MISFRKYKKNKLIPVTVSMQCKIYDLDIEVSRKHQDKRKIEQLIKKGSKD